MIYFMAKKKTTRTVSAKHLHKKAHLLTWVVFLALIIGLVGGFLFAKAKYMYRIDLISVMFSQRDSELNEMKAKLNKMKSTDQQAEF